MRIPNVGDTVVWKQRFTGAELAGRVVRVLSPDDLIQVERYSAGPPVRGRFVWVNITDIKEVHPAGVRGGG